MANEPLGVEAFLAYVASRNRAIGLAALVSGGIAAAALLTSVILTAAAGVAICVLAVLIGVLLGSSWIATKRLLGKARAVLAESPRLLDISTWSYRGYRDPSGRGRQMLATIDLPGSSERAPLATARVHWTTRGLGQFHEVGQVFGHIAKGETIVVTTSAGVLLASIRKAREPLEPS
jgi:hypothetical protein